MVLLIFSFLFLASFCSTNIFGYKDPDLPEDFFRKWKHSQVFIYYKIGYLQKFQEEYPYPDCFGNLFTAEHVLTATTCFIDMDTFVQIYMGNQKGQKKFKTDIDKVLVAKVGTYNVDKTLHCTVKNIL